MPHDTFEDYDASPETRTMLVAEPGGPRLTLSRCLLHVTAGPDRGRRVTVDKPILRVGASERCDLVLEDPTVSRFHCEVREIGEQWRLVDRGSTNGTFVGDLQVYDVVLTPGMEFSAGGSAIRFSPIAEEVRIHPAEADHYGEILGASRRMRELYALLERLAPSELALVVEGDTGTGKELVAKAIHGNSLRKAGPLVVFDCSAFPQNLLESELFGHEKGAFSGAVRTHRGVFERADRGTLFLDELGELDLPLQPKLLRALETGEFRRVGGERPIQVDVRLLAATNRDLGQMVEEGGFRQDLYYRLAKVRLQLPPLRERRGDIPLLSEHFIRELAPPGGPLPARRLSRDAVRALQAYDWPGNVRELRNVIERAVTFADNEEVSLSDLPPEVGGGTGAGCRPLAALTDSSRLRMPFKDAKEHILAAFEREYVVELLRRHHMNVSAAAREAGVDRRHIYRLLDKHDIPLPARGGEGLE